LGDVGIDVKVKLKLMLKERDVRMLAGGEREGHPKLYYIVIISRLPKGELRMGFSNT
jgi:hypothetical protein